MRELGDVDGTDAAVAEEARPVVLEILVKHAVPNIVGEEVLHLDGSTKAEGDLGVDAVRERRVSLGNRRCQ